VFDDGEHGPSFLGNPELYDGDGEVSEEEGCLSIPGPYHATTARRSVVSVGST
jgi:peptide deformylase